MNDASFRAFCAIGDVDPDQWHEWTTHPTHKYPHTTYIWLSRSKDIVFETSSNPLKRDGYCHHFGLTGISDKAIAMYNFMHDHHTEEETSDMGTHWEDMCWDRQYI
jgi:hypothetical protein